MQRLQKAVKNKQHFLFYFVSATTTSRSMQQLSLSTSPLGSGYPSLLMFFLCPSQKLMQRTTKLEAPLPHVDRNVTICLCQPSQPFPPVLNPIWDSQPSQLFKSSHWQASFDKRRMNIDWAQWVSLNPNKTLAEVFIRSNKRSNSRPRQFMWPPSHYMAKHKIVLPLFQLTYGLEKNPTMIFWLSFLNYYHNPRWT